jgi:class 3 adenylate cyclase/tetratricopeptide (TPR) repeat protein
MRLRYADAYSQKPDRMSLNLPLSGEASLASFLPRVQHRLIAAGRAVASAPVEERRSGAILLVDVSGFTELAERFTSGSAGGAEELSRVLNAYFGRVSRIVAGNSGDIIAFAGDAVLAFWPAATQEELEVAAYQAARSARSIQKELATFQLPGNVTLRQRASVAAGDLTVMELGGISGCWQLLVAGKPIAEAGELNAHVTPGEVLISSAIWELVKTRCRGTTLPSGNVRIEETLEAAPTPAQISDQFTPAAAGVADRVLPIVVDRIQAGHGAWLAEFRNISVLFVHLEGADAARLESCDFLHAAVQTMQRTLFRYGGSVYQFLMDDKGIVLIGIFGLPPLAHEDDAARAVQSGLAIHEELHRSGLRSSIGITTGRAFCGVLGSEERRQYAAVGTVVNLSSRLMQMADGRVICDKATFQSARTRTELSFDLLGDIRVKGKSDPVPAYLPRKIASQQDSGVIDREAGRSMLSQALAALVHQKLGACIVLEGEPGIGKSRLVEYLVDKARALNVPCLFGIGDPVENSAPYFVWRGILRTLFRLDLEFGEAAVQRDRIAAQLQGKPELQELIPLLGAVLAVDIPDNHATAQMSGEARSHATQNLLVQLLQSAASSGPYLLVLEDVHWFDSASLAVADLVVRQVHSMLFVVTSRPIPDPAPPRFQDLLTAAGEGRMKLEVMAIEDSLELARLRLGVESLPPVVAGFLERRAGGQPLFVQELAYSLRDTGLIEIEQGRCTLAARCGGSLAGLEEAFGKLNIPNTIQGVITSRVDRLPPPQQLTLKVASVIGQSFALSILEDVFPVANDKKDIRTYLDDLEKLGLTRRVSSTMYEFKHSLTQTVVYSLVAFANRSQLHRAIAQWHEKHFADDLSPYYALLAHHWNLAEDAAKAIEFSARAGEQALSRFANEEAVHFLQQVLALDSKQPPPSSAKQSPDSDRRRAEWRLGLGKAFVNLSNYGDARANLEKGLKALEEPIPGNVLGAASIVFAQLARQVMHRWWPARFLGRRSTEREILLQEASAYEGLTESYYLASLPLHTVAAGVKSLNLAELAGPSPELARGYASFGALMGFVPLHGLAESYSQRAMQTAEASDNVAALAWVSMIRGIYETGIGKWDSASALFDSVVRINTRLGDERHAGDGTQLLASVAYFRGDFKESLQLVDGLYASAVRRNDRRVQAEALRWKGHSLLELGKLQELSSCVDELQKLRTAGTSGDVFNQADVYALLAALHTRRGEKQKALETIDEAARRAIKVPNSSSEMILERTTIAETYLRLWEMLLAESNSSDLANVNAADLLRCRQGANKASKALGSLSRVFPIGGPFTLLWSGLCHDLEGHSGKASAAWTKSLAAAKDLQMSYAEALAEYELGRHLPAHDPHRKAHLQRASDMFRQVGAAYDLSRAEQALRAG